MWRCLTEPPSINLPIFFAMAILGPTAKYNSRQYFWLYGMSVLLQQDKQPILSAGHELWQIKKPQPHHNPMPPPQAQAKQHAQPPKTFGISLNEADHHSVLFNQLEKHSAKWRTIGRCLGFLPSKLDIIQAKPLLLDGAPSSWLEELLVQWLRLGDATLETLRNALYDAGLGKTAADLHIYV